VPVLLSMGLILFLFVFGISYRSNGPKKTKDSIYFFLILVLVLLLIVALPYLFKTPPISALENKNSFEVNATINFMEGINNDLKVAPSHKKVPKKEGI
jgi:multisubunit Na+/H+ antiporter MnhB subunit